MAGNRDERDDFDLAPTGAAAPFPSEHEWLDLPAPPVDDDFVERTLLALQVQAALDDAAAEPPSPLSRRQLDTFAPPSPSAGFVDGTLARLAADRRQRWQEILARHVAPEPSSRFVQRTLAALQAQRPQRRWFAGAAQGRTLPRRAASALPWLIAAAAVLWFALRPSAAVPLEQRIADSVAPAYSHADTCSPMPTLLTRLAQREDAAALPIGNPDGLWLLQEVR